MSLHQSYSVLLSLQFDLATEDSEHLASHNRHSNVDISSTLATYTGLELSRCAFKAAVPVIMVLRLLFYIIIVLTDHSTAFIVQN